jgi:hypothetical protein
VIDVTAAQMLIELGHDLKRQGKRLVLARQVGQVRAILGAEGGPPRSRSIVREAVDALRADSPTGRAR